MTGMSDSEALDHYRIEVARIRRALQDWADALTINPVPDPATAWVCKTTIVRILEGRQ